MKHLELHILQSVPVTCLNRDDLGSPKTAFFGGVQRARVSSQCWKRAVREYAHEISPYFEGHRSRLIIEPLRDELIKLGKSEEDALELAKKIADKRSNLDVEKIKAGKLQVKTLYYTSRAEIEAIAKASILEEEMNELSNQIKQSKKDDNKDLEKELSEKKKVLSLNIKSLVTPDAWIKDAADLALFGRMVANDHSLTIEGAAMFNHPISTHKVDNELDFFAAVDDWQKGGDSGAGMTGTLEYNSSVYYRFAALNLNMLSDKEHLACMAPEERKEVVTAFTRATLEAVPGMTESNSGRKNSMNGYTRPSYVLGIIREKGHPIQFINAFEDPIWSGAGRGIMKASIEKLQKEEQQQNKIWKLEKEQLLRVSIEGTSLDKKDLLKQRSDMDKQDDKGCLGNWRRVDTKSNKKSISGELDIDQFIEELVNYVE
jgi:CRISPR system Cascade subunit CasC